MAKRRDDTNDAEDSLKRGLGQVRRPEAPPKLTSPQPANGATAIGAGRSRREDPSDWLGRGLRRLYQDTVKEPIPDKFRSLLDQLDRQEADERAELGVDPDETKGRS